MPRLLLLFEGLLRPLKKV